MEGQWEVTDKRVSVIGLGYAGLPLALAFARAGILTVGIDISEEKVNLLKNGKSYLTDVNDDQVRQVQDLFQPTTDYAAVEGSTAVIICVPTPVKEAGEPDVSAVINAGERLGPFVKRGMLIVLQSTTFPGTTEEILRPILERRSGLQAGQDFCLAYSPERIDPGNKEYNLTNTPKLVGGCASCCSERAKRLFENIVTKAPIYILTSPRVAEAAKLFENTFRFINIALVNELAYICRALGISVWEVLDAAATKPFGFTKFTPGPGAGGHCIPVDPLYLLWNGRRFNQESRFIQLAHEINNAMPHIIVNIVADVLNERGLPVRDRTFLILGVAYKPDVNDPRHSPALPIMDLLMRKKGIVFYHDPFIDKISFNSWTAESVPLSQELLHSCDCVIIVTPHSCYDWRWIVDNARLVVDTRGVTRHLMAKNVVLL
ncbi:MAG: nucleotide sugar dehydrogenase [Armatimonadetes bacterium]|nr:nucleotide sugar dehydrogenase [Armatimonadota bacterium]MDW8121425.1 nucleotide sugar dehydrogenase [Armatimonadota bacterium]